MSLRTFLSEVTHREYLTWLEFLKNEWNHPTKTDNYLMQIAAEVKRVLSKSPNKIKIEHFILKFFSGKKESNKPKQTKEEYSALSKARWFGFLGKKRNGRSTSRNSGSKTDSECF